MPRTGRPCLVCSAPTAIRKAVDDAILAGCTAAEIGRTHDFSIHAVTRHNANHLRPRLVAMRAALGIPTVRTPAAPAAHMLDIGGIASRFASAVAEAEAIIADARSEGTLAMRAIGVQALTSALTRAAAVARMLAQPVDEVQPVSPAADDIARAVLGEVSDPTTRTAIAARLAGLHHAA